MPYPHAMTKKHYIALAEEIKARYATESRLAGPDREGRLAGIRIAAHAVADVCAQDNSRFNRERFLAACCVNAV